jgi:hypothetical protein
MPELSDGPNAFGDSQVNGGGADAVEKTTYVVGQGTDPRAPDPRIASANVPSGGINPAVWIVLAIVVVVAVVYGLGALR